jgi:hypothetical protein
VHIRYPCINSTDCHYATPVHLLTKKVTGFQVHRVREGYFIHPDGWLVIGKLRPTVSEISRSVYNRIFEGSSTLEFQIRSLFMSPMAAKIALCCSGVSSLTLRRAATWKDDSIARVLARLTMKAALTAGVTGAPLAHPYIRVFIMLSFIIRGTTRTSSRSMYFFQKATTFTLPLNVDVMSSSSHAAFHKVTPWASREHTTGKSPRPAAHMRVPGWMGRPAATSCWRHAS